MYLSRLCWQKPDQSHDVGTHVCLHIDCCSRSPLLQSRISVTFPLSLISLLLLVPKSSPAPSLWLTSCARLAHPFALAHRCLPLTSHTNVSDAAGEYDKLKHLVMHHLRACKIIALATLGLQLMALMVSCTLYYAENKPYYERLITDYDSASQVSCHAPV